MTARLLRETRPAVPAAISLALTLLIAAACVAPKETAKHKESEAPAPTPLTKDADAQDVAAPTVAALETESLDARPELPPAKAEKPPPPPINDDPHQLMGLAPHAVNRLLGPPSLLRAEAPAEVWQYTAENCVLDIYLYVEEKTPDRSRVTYYEIRLPDSAKSGARACFAEIIQSQISARETVLDP